MNKILEIIQAKKITGKELIFQNVNLDLIEGDRMCLLGSNGSGKSTFIKTIAGLSKLDQGTIKVMGYDNVLHLEDCLSHIGYMSQEINLPMASLVLDVLINYAGYFGIDYKEAEERAIVMLNAFSLFNVKDYYCSELSGGMMRRLMAARALMSNPKILILDEPTAGVDIKYRYKMWDFIKSFIVNHKAALILISHHKDECEYLGNKFFYLSNSNVNSIPSIDSVSDYFEQMLQANSDKNI